MKSVSSSNRILFSAAVLAALAAITSGCASRISTPAYAQYKGQVVTVVRPGALTYDGEAPFNARTFAFRETPKAIDIDPLNPEASFSRMPKRVFGEPTIIRPILAGEKILIKDIVLVAGLEGVWADAVLQTDDEDCLIPADNGLADKLILLEKELEAWGKIPPDVRSLIVNHEIRVGMTKAQVWAAWGAPDLMTPATGPGGVQAQRWTYRRGPRSLIYLKFVGEKLISYTK